ncbi:MAG TPA: hypothetical protein VJR90_11325 [Gammaproteobacteria bacterium]|nr:hypothetical protein [Gammaproteobacteria bacterium]
MFNNPAKLTADAPEVLRVGLIARRVLTWAGTSRDSLDTGVRVNLVEEIHGYDVGTLDWRGGEPTLALALEVLDRYLPPAWGQCAVWRGGRTLHTSAAALYLHRDFAHFLTAQLPFWGGVVEREVIRGWIMAEGLSSMQQHIGAWPLSRVFKGMSAGVARQ